MNISELYECFSVVYEFIPKDYEDNFKDKDIVLI